MFKVAILDDYQNVSHEFVALEKLSKKYEFKVFSEPFTSEEEAIEQLLDYEALLIMRERTPITENLIKNLKKLKFIITSGMRNKSINFEATKKRKIIVSGTDINPNPAAELTWALILGLARNIKPEIDNMFQGYWQTTIGTELKGKILGIIGLGKIGSQVAKVGKIFGSVGPPTSDGGSLTFGSFVDSLIFGSGPANREPFSGPASIIPTSSFRAKGIVVFSSD